jgi:arylsulfatase A-like enzyme
MNSPRNLLLITVDCLRADHVGHLGYHRPTTPFLDCLAAESTVFRNAIAAGTPTYYSLPALLASRYPLALGRDVVGIAPEETTIASVLQECGVATAAFSAGNPYICEQFGYDRGFEVFCDFNRQDFRGQEIAPEAATSFRTQTNQLLSRFCHSVPGLDAAYDELHFRYCRRSSSRPGSLDSLRRFPSADVIVDHALAWLAENSGRPFFLWLHLMDPHAPYFPKAEALELMKDANVSPAEAVYLNSYWARGDLSQKRLEKKRRDVIKLYDAGIRWADQQIERLSERLVELNLWDKCAVAVTADHGEEFLDHGGRFHAPERLTEELIHVPLTLRVPGAECTEVEAPISLVDLAPTLLDILGLPSPADFRGRNRCGRLETRSEGDVAITETISRCTNPFRPEKRGGPRILALRKQNLKLVINFADQSEQWFDLAADPQERNPIPASSIGSEHRALLRLAQKHLAESHKSRDFDRRNAALVRALRIEWTHPAAGATQ